ncbi:putative baseplate assembly protein [Streptomyces sp. NPDC048419]|uniref:putative baseplate assembly protein n=1 Tax=Streptomyces sp. NPDC048419 TaxID=3365547 RepID=UPI003718340F
MGLPAPNLDDRRFQDLVDDAKRLIMRRCPEWTDHNVSDPGITMIETFAYMTDQLLYRLNRVPDRLYIKFLNLIGVRMLPPTPARVPVSFWLSRAALTQHVIPAHTRVATVRTETIEAISFATLAPLAVVPAVLKHLGSQRAGSDEFTGPADSARFPPFPAFGEVPQPGDCLAIGLQDAVAACTVRLDLTCDIEGIGVNPNRPPLQWEAWTSEGWAACDVSQDSTGGLNRKGIVMLHVPQEHETSLQFGHRAGWLRARVTEPEDPGQPRYSSPPVIRALHTTTVGGTAEAIHAEIVEDEVLGTAEGVPGQHFSVRRAPMLTGAGEAILEVTVAEGWERWHQVTDFASSGPDDKHVVFDETAGTVMFGPAVRQPDGTVRQHGAVPAAGAIVCMRRYATGGGRKGNVARSAIHTLKSSIPFVARVENRYAAQGGVDGETVEEAKERGPLVLRARSRAVTAEDYEAITREAAPEIARVKCLTAGEHDVDAGAVKVLVVPAAASENGIIQFEDLVPSPATMERIAARLDEVRLVGARVLVEPPRYQGMTVVARLVAHPNADLGRIKEEALDRLYAFLNPLTGGHDGTGWPFGRDVQSTEVSATLQGVRGVDFVDDIRIFGANPVTAERGRQVKHRMTLEPYSLVYSFQHQLLVEAAP